MPKTKLERVLEKKSDKEPEEKTWWIFDINKKTDKNGAQIASLIALCLCLSGFEIREEIYNQLDEEMKSNFKRKVKSEYCDLMETPAKLEGSIPPTSEKEDNQEQ